MWTFSYIFHLVLRKWSRNAAFSISSSFVCRRVVGKWKRNSGKPWSPKKKKTIMKHDSHDRSLPWFIILCSYLLVNRSWQIIITMKFHCFIFCSYYYHDRSPFFSFPSSFLLSDACHACRPCESSWSNEEIISRNQNQDVWIDVWIYWFGYSDLDISQYDVYVYRYTYYLNNN